MKTPQRCSRALQFVLIAASLASGQAAAPPTAIKPCPAGTLSSYSGLRCTQGPPGAVVTYDFPDGFYTILPPGAGVTGNDVTVRLDPNGPYTLLIGSTAWNPPAGANSFHLAMHFTVSGAVKTSGWMHDCKGDATGTIAVDAAPTETAISTCRNPQVGAMYNRKTPTGATVQIDLKRAPGAAPTTLRSFGVHFHP